MMGLLLIAAGAIGWWAWSTRDRRTMRFADVAAVVAALIGLRLIQRHEMLPGLAALGGAGWWYWFRRRGGPGEESGMSAEHARAVLDVSRDATIDEIRAAHRRLIARVHPDAGGSTRLTAEVNLARDTLISQRS